MRFYISDLHFFHEALNTRMDCRGFSDAAEMNAYMIRQWNSRVRNKDDVVILGDFSFGKAQETMAVLEQLNGRKYLIRGNHDSRYLDDNEFDLSLFKWVKDYEELSDEHRKVVLCHYPIMCYNGQYRYDEEGKPRTYMLYGHVHNTFDELLIDRYQRETRNTRRLIYGGEEEQPIPCRMINCFCQFSDYIPLTLDEWIEKDAARRKELETKGLTLSSPVFPEDRAEEPLRLSPE